VGLKLVTADKKLVTFPLNFVLSLIVSLYCCSPVPCPLFSKDSTYVSIGIGVCGSKQKHLHRTKIHYEKFSLIAGFSMIENKVTFWCEKINK
jgi:hypothetical protein